MSVSKSRLRFHSFLNCLYLKPRFLWKLWATLPWSQHSLIYSHAHAHIFTLYGLYYYHFLWTKTQRYGHGHGYGYGHGGEEGYGATHGNGAKVRVNDKIYLRPTLVLTFDGFFMVSVRESLRLGISVSFFIPPIYLLHLAYVWSVA